MMMVFGLLPLVAGGVAVVLDVGILLVGLLLLRTRRRAGLAVAVAGLAGLGAVLGVVGMFVMAALFGAAQWPYVAAGALPAAFQIAQVVALVRAHRTLAVAP